MNFGISRLLPYYPIKLINITILSKLKSSTLWNYDWSLCPGGFILKSAGNPFGPKKGFFSSRGAHSAASRLRSHRSQGNVPTVGRSPPYIWYLSNLTSNVLASRKAAFIPLWVPGNECQINTENLHLTQAQPPCSLFDFDFFCNSLALTTELPTFNCTRSFFFITAVEGYVLSYLNFGNEFIKCYISNYGTDRTRWQNFSNLFYSACSVVQQVMCYLCKYNHDIDRSYPFIKTFVLLWLFCVTRNQYMFHIIKTPLRNNSEFAFDKTHAHQSHAARTPRSWPSTRDRLWSGVARLCAARIRVPPRQARWCIWFIADVADQKCTRNKQ